MNERALNSSRAIRRARGCFVTLVHAACFTIPLTGSRTASAEPPSAAKLEPCASTARKSLATGAALVPGIIVHGTGHFVRCDPVTGRRLLGLEGLGVVATGVSGAGLALTGASRYFVAPFAVGAWGGVSLFAFTLLADIYGAAGLSEVTGRAPLTETRLLVEAGLGYVYDRQFRYRSLASQGFRVETPWLWLAPHFDTALNARNQRVELRAGHRWFGPSSWRASRDGSRLDLELAFYDHAYVDEGFALSAVETALSGRLDLARVGASLAGSFAEASLGYARQWTRIEGLATNGNDELLLRSAFGVYLGRGRFHGEALLAYDHRRDTFAGGLLPGGIVAGYLGFLEQRTDFFFGHLGVRTQLKYGSALLLSASLLVALSP
jgi:hypothetical protein